MMHDSENDAPQLQNGEQGLTTSPLRATVRFDTLVQNAAHPNNKESHG